MDCNSSTFSLANGTTRVKERAECNVTPEHGRSLLAWLGLVAGAVVVLRWVTG